MKIDVKINNMPTHNLEKYPYIIVKAVEGGLWYYGADSSEIEAHKLAEELGNAFVFYNDMVSEKKIPTKVADACPYFDNGSCNATKGALSTTCEGNVHKCNFYEMEGVNVYNE